MNTSGRVIARLREREIDRPVLADLLEREGRLTVAEYAGRLHETTPDVPLEPAMLAAFRCELERVGLTGDEVRTALESAERRRVLQTTTHTALSEGPVFLASHYVGSLGLPPDAPYLVGAFSGIAFSNSSRPGCVSYGRLETEELLAPTTPLRSVLLRSDRNRALDTRERRLSLIPGRLRDALVHGSRLPTETAERVAALRGPIREVLPEPCPGAPFTAWAARVHAALHGRILGRRVVSLDINEVVRSYLLTVLDDGSHPLHKLLFQADCRQLVLGQSPPLPLFHARSSAGRRETVAPLRMDGDVLRGPGWLLALRPEAILDGLRAGQLSPGTFLELASLAFVNGFCCFGGADQLEYLRLYRDAWSAAGALPRPRQVPLDRLTSGLFVDDEAKDPILPLDVLYGTPFEPDPNATLIDFLENQLVRLLNRPFRWSRA